MFINIAVQFGTHIIRHPLTVLKQFKTELLDSPWDTTAGKVVWHQWNIILNGIGWKREGWELACCSYTKQLTRLRLSTSPSSSTTMTRLIATGPDKLHPLHIKEFPPRKTVTNFPSYPGQLRNGTQSPTIDALKLQLNSSNLLQLTRGALRR